MESNNKIAWYSIIGVAVLLVAFSLWSSGALNDYLPFFLTNDGWNRYEREVNSSDNSVNGNDENGDGTASLLTEAEARAIAEQSCIKGGDALSAGSYNDITKTWWFDANLNATREGCNPACVVSEDTKTAEINWRCTGAIPPDASVQDPVPAEPPLVGGDQDEHGCKGSAGYSWCEAKQKCVRIWEESCESKEIFSCTPEQRKNDVCAEIYQPVCGTVQVQCVTTPCDPIQQSFENACSACRNALVSSYTEGSCEGDQPQKICPDDCPLLSQPEPGWCDDGIIIPGKEDECGCMMHPTCKR